MSSLTDDQLMAGAAEGNHSALVELLDRHGDAVYGYCMRALNGNRAMVEDVAQEVWLKVLRSAGSYRAEGHFKAWLMTVTRNATISVLRRELPAHLQEEAGEQELGSDFDLEAELLRRYDMEAIRAAVAELAPSQRAVLLLWLEEDASYESIGEKLGLPYVSVRSILQRARQNLRQRLEKK